MPCRPARARQLLRKGKAAVFRRYPFTIILKEREGGNTQPVSLNVDPGSKTTGLALVALFQRGQVAIYGQHVVHRGQQIRNALDSRRATRMPALLFMRVTLSSFVYCISTRRSQERSLYTQGAFRDCA